MAEVEAEDRTQAPSTPRRQQARARGQVAQSRELSASAGLLASAAVLSFWGDRLASALRGIVAASISGPVPVTADAAGVVADLRGLALGVAGPLGLIAAAFPLGALAAHLAQTRGLWAPGLLAPDVARLWGPGQSGGLVARGERGLWGLAKTAVVVAVGFWVLRADWSAFQGLDGLDVADLARAVGQSLRHLLWTLAAATLALGAVDFWFQTRRFDALLRLTPEEHREDLRAMEGDPSLRARRRRLARSWRGDAPELLASSTLLLTGSDGLTVVLAGGPPPRRVLVRSIVTGRPGAPLRRAADSAGVPSVSAPDLARRLAARRPPSLPLAPDHLADLAALWPVEPSL